MKYFSIIIIFILNYHLIGAQSELSNKELLDSLQKCLFPSNSESEKSVVLQTYDLKDSVLIIKGNKNRPESQKISALLKEIRTRKLILEIKTIKNYYEQITAQIKSEWNVNLLTFWLENEIKFFEDFELTLFSLYVDSMYISPIEKFKFVRKSYENVYKESRSILQFSDYYQKYGPKLITKEHYYIREHAEELKEPLMDFFLKYQPVSSDYKIAPAYYLYISTIPQAFEAIEDSRIDDLLVNSYEKIRDFNPFWIIKSLGKRANPPGIAFLIDNGVVNNLPNTEKQFFQNGFANLSTTEKGCIGATNYLIKLSSENIKKSNIAEAKRLIKEIPNFPCKEGIDYLFSLKGISGLDEISQQSLSLMKDYINSSSRNEELKKYINDKF